MEHFERLDLRLLCWERAPAGSNAPPVPAVSLNLEFDAPEYRASRWLRRLRLLPTGNLNGADGEERRRLEAVIRDWAPDVILCHFGSTALRVLPVAETLNIPLVAHFHGCDISSMLRNRYYALSLKSCARRFDHCVVVGSHQRRILQRFGVAPARISLIPCGAPTDAFPPKTSYATDCCRFLAVSRLVPWKGVDYTVRAFAEARRRLPAAELHIVGAGHAERTLRRLVADLQVDSSVIFHGVQPPHVVQALMARCDVFVQHSLDYKNGWQEGFGVSIAEASSSGLPVLVTDAGGICDQIVDGENGLVTPQRDVGAMAEGMVRLAADEALRCRLGTAGHYRASRDLDAGMLSRRLERLLLTTAFAHGSIRASETGRWRAPALPESSLAKPA